MKEIAAETLITRLVDWGVDTIFGLPGDGINGLFEALRRHQDRIRFVLVHHEQAAAFMACAYAKTTGRLGVCIATPARAGCTCSTASTTRSSTSPRPFCAGNRTRWPSRPRCSRTRSDS